MDWNQILLWVTPFVVYAVTALVKWAIPIVPGWIMVYLVVPLVSFGITALATIVVPDDNMLLQFVLGLVAVFLSQLKIQLSSAKVAEDKAEIAQVKALK